MLYRSYAVVVACLLVFACHQSPVWGARIEFGLPQDMVAETAIDPRFLPLVERLAASGYPRERLERLYSRSEVSFDPDSMGKKMRVLYKVKYKPATPAPQPQADQGKRERIPLHAPHLTPEVVERLAVFKERYAETLRKAEKQYGVPQDVILAVLVVETKLGNFLGSGTALNVLSSMAVAQGYADLAPYLETYAPTPSQKEWLLERQAQKAEWALGQLRALLEYGWANGLDLAAMPGSIYGAIGMCQFMPSNVERLGVDGDQDGVVDVYAPADAVHSVAKFLHKAGWKAKLSRKRKISVIKRYNPDYFYAITVLAVADEIPKVSR